MNYINEIACVKSNELIAVNTYRVILDSPEISKISKPGQFVNILPSLDWDKAMRRPMSLANSYNGYIELIYKVFGEGTDLMSKWSKGDSVDIIGPLGNCWSNFNKTPILIGGGVGIAPITYLSKFLNKNDISHYLIMGARSSKEHFLKHDLDKKNILSTDDGSAGVKGNVVDALRTLKLDCESIKIFSCGPPLMMESIKKYTDKNKIDCDLALETIMACGFGICQGCTVEFCSDESKEHSYRSKFGLVCLDGPIFNAKDITTCIL